MKPVAHQYEDKLLEFAYGELSANEENAVSAHVKTCAKCKEALAGIKVVRQSMRQLPVEPAPEAGLDSLLAYAEQAAQRNAQGRAKSRSPWSKWVGALSAVAAMSTVVWVTVSSQYKLEPAAVVSEAKQAQLKEEAKREWNPREQVKSPELAYGQGEEANALEKAEAPTPAAAPLAAQPAPQVQYPSGTRRDKAARNTLSEGDEGLLAQRSAEKMGNKLEDSITPAMDDARLRQDFGNANARGGREPAQTYPDTTKKKQSAAKDSQDFVSYGAGGDELAKSYGPGKGDSNSKGIGGLGSAGSGSYGTGSGAMGSAGTAGEAEQQQRPSLGLSVKSSAAKTAPKPADRTKAQDTEYPFAENKPAAPPAAAAPYAAPSEARAEGASAPRKSSSAGADDNDAYGINVALKALKEAKGSERAQLLKRLCDGFEAEGKVAQAEEFCGMLLKEFPESAAAKAVATRKARMLEESNKKAKALEKNAPAAAEPAY